MLLNEYVAGRLAHRRPLLMTHVVCGYPSFEDNWRELEIMAARGVDFVESAVKPCNRMVIADALAVVA